jgi:predicted metal-dependent phosphoesterase TrpH
MHTTASDGLCTPADLVDQAWAVGIRALSVTDHDTRAGIADARKRADELGIEFTPGIEITAVHGGKDVHVLAYGLPESIPAIETLMTEQRRARVNRAREIAHRLARQGAPIDIDGLIASTMTGKAVARPQIARYLIAAGHVSSVAEAFDTYLAEGQPAYVPHEGADPTQVVALIREAGGVSSLAHPGPLKRDELIPALVDARLDAIEAYHSAHDDGEQAHYLELARRFGLLVTGGSDYHGPGTRRAEHFGVMGLPAARYAAFRERLGADDDARRAPPLG